MLRPPCPDDLRRDRDASTGQATYPLGPGSLDREPTLPDLDGARVEKSPRSTVSRYGRTLGIGGTLRSSQKKTQMWE
jgi:hypothetical protein